MLDFWDHLWLAKFALVEDYYREKREQEKKWENFCQESIQEILSDGVKLVQIVQDNIEKQSGIHVHEDLVNGLKYLPIYAFYLVLGGQDKISKEQSNLLKLYFSHFEIPFTVNYFLQAVRSDNSARKEILDLVGISKDRAGRFWIQFYKVLYRTDADTKAVSDVIDSFCDIMMRFAAISHKDMDYLMPLMKRFVEAVHIQADLCRAEPDDMVDFYGDQTFLEHFQKYKYSVFTVCNHTMDPKDEDLNPVEFFKAFTIGIIYQVIRKCTRSRSDKIMIMDDILNQCDVGAKVDGAYVFKYMEDLQGEDTSMLAAMAQIFTDPDVNDCVGWVMLTRGSGTYNLDTHKDINPVQDAINFIIGMENYLVDKYPMSGFGNIAPAYARLVMDIINMDIDMNVTIVDEDTHSEYKRSENVHNPSTSESTNGTGKYSNERFGHIDDSFNRQTDVIKSPKGGSHFMICPKCGELVPINQEKNYCSSCYENYDNMSISEKDYASPLSEMKYYSLSFMDRKRYEKFCFFSERHGLILRPFNDKDGYHEDYFSDPFRVVDGIIIKDDDVLPERYKEYGDFLYDPYTLYNGRVPNKDYFDGDFTFNSVTKDIRFKSNGTVMLFDGDSQTAPISDEGKYIREGDLIRADLVARKTGEKRTTLWLVVDGRLCMDTYVSDKAFSKLEEFARKEMPNKSFSIKDIFFR